jgi:Transcriptional Coactivator p15 (PC4)
MTYPTEENPLILRKTEKEEIRVYTSTYKGKTRAHMRKYWLDPKEDAWKPSREGIALSAGELPEALKALQAIHIAGVLN